MDDRYGFQLGRDTKDSILKVINIVSSSESDYVLDISLDISGAYNNLWWPSPYFSCRNVIVRRMN